MKKEVTLAKILSLPLAFSKKIIENNLPINEFLKTVEEEGLLEKYKGPYCSDVKSSYIFNDTITVNCFEESKQPDGTYLISYIHKYIEEYKLSLYVRVLTSGLKRKLKYHHFDKGTKLKVKGDLDMYVTGPMLFDEGKDLTETKWAVIGVAVTIIDIL